VMISAASPNSHGQPSISKANPQATRLKNTLAKVINSKARQI
jgi:hypothetical protein